MSHLEKMQELIDRLNTYSYHYYQLDDPIVSDKVYDDALDELAALESETGIPNNKKKMLGLSLTRISGKKKKIQKSRIKKRIVSFNLFDVIEEIIDRTICQEWKEQPFFNKFVDVKDMQFGDKNYE